MQRISNDLLAAYTGFYEDEGLTREDIIAKILADPPKKRLTIYCVWNGIVGYSGRLFEIAIGEL